MRILICAAGLCLCSLARAQATQPAEPEPSKEEDKKPPVEIHGRVITSLLLVDQADVWTGELELTSGRVEVSYRWKDLLRAVVEVEVSGGNVELRDAFLRLDADPFRVRAGNFKVAFSGLALTSRLRLPLTDRGLLNDTLVDVYRIAGRHPGVQVEWRQGIGFADVGVWQGDTIEELGDGAGWRVAGRGGVSWNGDACDGEIALGVEVRSVRPTPFDPVEAELAAGLDARWERRFEPGALELWGEVIVGTTEVSADGDGATFFAGRGIAAWRFGGDKRGRWYAEPYGGFQFLDSDNEIRRDLTWELAFGVNGGMWRRWRGQLGAIVRRVGEQAPPGLGGDGQPLLDRNTIVAAIGMEF